MSECSICCENFNKTFRSKINCKTCDKNIIVCQACAKKYILDKPTDASCMVCNVEWDREFLVTNFSNKFVNKELKEHKEQFLFEKQLVLLPATQSYAENLKLINGIELQIKIIMKEKLELVNKVKKLNKHIREQYSMISALRNGNIKENNDNILIQYKCPVNECKGFLNNKYHCGICDNHICKHCMEIKDSNHICDEEKKKSVEFLRTDTKPCPKCGQLIHKLPNGCDQMYCIKCHTAFSWRTGRIERGTIHNPEYYRWMRENGQTIPRNPLDIVYDQCGNNLIDYMTLLHIIRKYYDQHSGRDHFGRFRAQIKDSPQTIKIANMHRLVGHINYLNTNYQDDLNNNDSLLRNYRANYLLNNLSEKNFKVKLQMLDKKQTKSKKLNDIWNVLRLVIIEYIGKITEKEYQKEEGQKIIEDIINESEKVRKYCNKSFSKIGQILNMTYPGINTEWVQIHNWKKYIDDIHRTNNNILCEGVFG
tara:strand:- start:482 stop:1918 length:1437 start_codon:yes stop_codon:yes gene_type:complete